ncbi:MAG: hypothetical protein HY691_14250 [Chloroflexi bacterium]|nr:hypothetical protein [Chloroflexota bacterium]
MAHAIQTTRTIEVLSPAGERRTAAVARTPGLPTLAGKVVGLLDNNKSNTAAFLDLLGRALAAEHSVVEIVGVRKGSAAQPVDTASLARLRRCDAVVTAFAD